MLLFAWSTFKEKNSSLILKDTQMDGILKIL